MKLPHIVIRLLSVCTVIFFVSCATQEEVIGAKEAGQYNVVVKESMPLKESGPNQTIPASKTIEAGTRCRIIGGGSLFLYIETIHGDRGFVPRSSVEMQKE